MECNIDYREDNRWTVYVHIVPKSLSGYDWDKYYVGITSNKVNERWQKGEGYKTQFFYRAIQKYGWDNISHEIIAEHLTENEAKNMEKELILKLKSYIDKYGYNATFGGDEWASNYKPVAQYDLNGSFICSYKSLREASLITGANHSGISHCCKGLSGQIGGFMWRYIINDIIIYKIEPYKRHTPESKIVLQYDLRGNFIKEWESVKLIENTIPNMDGQNIYACCNGRTIHSGGYQWRYKDESRWFSVNDVQDKMKTKKVYYQYDIDGNYICCYENSKMVHDKFGIYNSNLSTIVKNITDNYCNGFRWKNKYYDKLPKLKENYTIRKAASGKTEEEKIELGLLKYFYRYDIEGNFIDRFTNVSEKFREIKCNKSPSILHHKYKDITNNFYYGYRWTNQYYEKLPPLSEKGLRQVKEYEREN